MWNLLSKFVLPGKNFQRPDGPSKVPAPAASTRIKTGRIWKIFWASTFFLFLGYSGAKAQLVVGETGSLSVTWTNGAMPLNGVTVTASVPSDFTYNFCTGGIFCSENAGIVTWDVGTFAPNQSLTVSYNATVSSCATNSVTIFTSISASSPSTVANAAPLVYSVSCLTDTPTNTPTITFTPTLTPTPTITLTPTQTLSPTFTFTPSPTLTPTNSFTPTVTPTPTNSFTPTNTFTITMTPTITNTFTPTLTFTPTCPINVWPDPYSLRYAHDHSLKISCLPPNSQVYIYDLSGELVNAVNRSGDPTEWQWAKNQNGATVSPGVYFYAIKNGQTVLKRGKFLIVP